MPSISDPSLPVTYIQAVARSRLDVSRGVPCFEAGVDIHDMCAQGMHFQTGSSIFI